MKKNIYFLLSLTLPFLISCTSFKQVGKLNMISNRNVDPTLNYQIITTYSGGSKKELKKTKAEYIEDAIDQTVKKIPGGEFIMNAKIYLVNNKYFAVEGDVWGVGSNIAYRGFKVGDVVTWKKFGKFHKGKITGLKDDKTCLVENEEGKIIEIKYDEVTKSE